MNKTTRPLVPTSQIPAPIAPTAFDDGFIKSRIHTIRGEQMMLSSDLAELYDVEVKYLHRQVKRNQPRFPPDFVLHLSPDELKGLRCQIVTSNRGGDRYGLLAFTEQGVAMLSSVLKSDRAATVNVAIMRAFVAMRRALLSLGSMLARVEAMELRQAEDEARQLTAQARNDENQTRNEERFDTIFKAMDGGDFPPQKIFYDGQLWDARAFVDRPVKSARKSLLLVDHFSRMPPRDSVAGGIRRFSASLGPTLLRDRGHLFPSSRQLVVSSSSSIGRRGHSNPARAGGLPPRAMPGFPFRCVAEGPRQEVLRLHEDGPRGNSRAERAALTSFETSVRVAGSAPRHAPEPRTLAMRVVPSKAEQRSRSACLTSPDRGMSDRSDSSR